MLLPLLPEIGKDVAHELPDERADESDGEVRHAEAGHTDDPCLPSHRGGKPSLRALISARGELVSALAMMPKTICALRRGLPAARRRSLRPMLHSAPPPAAGRSTARA